jgi:caffeoyl-CoA O-methyltransferase
MARNTIQVSEELVAYMRSQSTPLDDLALRLQEETAALGDISRMQIAADEGLLLKMLVQIAKAKRVLEIGTFTGFSALMMARGGAERVVCLDVSEEWTAIARRYWREAGLDEVIELRLGPAAATLRDMSASERFDFAFIDADKPSYPLYFEEIMKRLEPGGIIAVDNTLWSGRVIDANDRSDDTQSIRRFNSMVVGDDGVEVVILPVADGLTLIRKKN